ncbi:MAG: sugar phosphate isomerase/epimerase, partial [Clostridium sp.]|nr:sugar phosphate isomerase/epimerase [Clostridium sp.]
IIFAHKLKASHVVLHPGFSDIPFENKKELIERSREAMVELSNFNRSYGVDLLIENVGNNTASIFNMEEYAYFLNDFPESMKYILDIGHANITKWDIPKLIQKLGPRLKAFHINDNDGERDIHLAIDEGTVNWSKVFEAIKKEERSYDLILEYNVKTDLGKLKEGKAILTKELF